MLPVLYLYPVLRPAALVGPVATLRHESLQTHLAGRAEQVGADLAAFERIDENSLGSACEQSLKVGLAQVQRQLAQIVIALGQKVERAELHLLVVLPGVERVEVGDAVQPEDHSLAVDDKLLVAVLQDQL